MMSSSREEVKQLKAKLRFRNDIIPLQNSVDIFGEETDFCLHFYCHLQKVPHSPSQNVTLLRRKKNLLDPNILITLYKDHVRPVMKYAPLHWRLLDKVQRRI